MLNRILTVVLAVGTLAAATAFAQTGSSTGSSTTSPSTSSPSTTTPSTTSPSTTSPMTGSGSSSGQQAQQPMGSSTFDAKKYKTKDECVIAATTEKVATSLCDSLR